MALLEFRPASRFDPDVVLINPAVPLGKWGIVGYALGDLAWQSPESGQRGLMGGRPGAGTPLPRQAALSLRVTATSKDDLALQLSTLQTAVSALRRRGGLVVLRPTGATRRAYLRVLTGQVQLGEWGAPEDQLNVARPLVQMTIAPLIETDEMDWEDDFTTDKTEGYTADEGDLADWTVTGGALVAVTNTAQENRFIVTGPGHHHPDVEVRARFTPMSGETKGGVVISRQDALNYITGFVYDTGSVSRLRIDVCVAGVVTNRASVDLGSRVTNAEHRYDVRARREGHKIISEYFPRGGDGQVASLTTSYTLSTGEQAAFPLTSPGQAGVVVWPNVPGADVQLVRVRPFTYRDLNRRSIPTAGSIPGDAPARADAWVQMVTPVSTDNVWWGLLAWTSRPLIGLLDSSSWEKAGSNAGWSGVESVPYFWLTGVATSAATTTTTARSGSYGFQVVTPATTGRGIERRFAGRFRAGQAYTAAIWVRSSSGSINLTLALGKNAAGQNATDAFAATTTWEKRTVTLTPTVDMNEVAIAVYNTGASGGTWFVDDYALWEGTAAAEPAPGNGRPPWGFLDATVDVTEASFMPTGTSPRVIVDASSLTGWYSPSASANPPVPTTGTRWFWNLLVSPHLLVPNDYSDSIEVEIWGRVRLSSLFDGGILAGIWDASIDGPEQATPVQRPTTNPSWELVRFGSKSLRIDPDAGGSSLIRLFVEIGAGTNGVVSGIDSIFMVNPRERIALPTGVRSLETGGWWLGRSDASEESWRIITADLASSTWTRGARGAGSASPSGPPIELPPGQLSLLMAASKKVPNDPDPSYSGVTSDVPYAGAVHLAVTPRYTTLPF